MARVIHFELHADQPERAIAFYRSSLGWEFEEYEGEDEYWIIRTGAPDEPGIDGGMVRRQAPLEGEGIRTFVCTVEVEDLDGTIEDVRHSGGQIVLDKQEVPGLGWLAYFQDTEGNILGALEPSAEAAEEAGAA